MNMIYRTQMTDCNLPQGANYKEHSLIDFNWNMQYNNYQTHDLYNHWSQNGKNKNIRTQYANPCTF